MSNAPKNTPETALPLAGWEAEKSNLISRMAIAKRIAEVQLDGYTNDDIDDIWETIKPALFFEKESECQRSQVHHPPIDRLFDVAIYIDRYTNSVLEGEIAPEDLCAVYALKTIQYAETLDEILPAALVLIDAWRALSFRPRSAHLNKSLKIKQSHIEKAQKANKEGLLQRDKERQVFYVFAAYEKIFDALQNQKKTGKLTPKSPLNKDLLRLKKRRYNYEYAAEEIRHILAEDGTIDPDSDNSLSLDQIISIIQRYDREKKHEQDNLKRKSKVVVVSDTPFRWPEKVSKTRGKVEVLSGEIPEFQDKDRTDIHDQVKKWLKEKEFRDSIENRISELFG